MAQRRQARHVTFALLFTLATASFTTQPTAQSTPTTGVIAGRVIEEGTNAPIADARISLFSMARPADGQVPQSQQTTSARDGTFRFEGLAPGRYRLNGQKAGYVMPGSVIPLPPPVEIEAGGPPAAPVVVLQRGGVIAGRVLAPGGDPIVQAPVFALQRKPGDPSGPLLMAAPFESTNDLGEFRIHSLAAGDYDIQAAPRSNYSNAPSTTVLARTFYPGTAEASTAQPVRVAAGATIGGIDISLLQLPAYAIRGVVVDEGGIPVANAGVMLSGDRTRESSITQSRTRSGPDGAFAIEGVQSGTYRLNAAWPNASKSERPGVSGSSTGPGGVRVITEFRNGITTELRFEPAGEVGIEVQNDHVSGVQLIVKRP